MIGLGILHTYNEEKIEYIGYMEYSDIYDENDLKTETINMGEKNIDYIKISGLKNKKIENKINKKLYDISKKYKEEGKKPYPHVIYNAYNILSISYNEKHVHIDLTTGNEIKLKDLIDSDNITPIISQGYYESISLALKAYINDYELIMSMTERELKSETDKEEIEKKEQTIERCKKNIKEAEDILKNVVEQSVIYAKKIDDDVEFEIFYDGIRIPNIDVGMRINRNYITLNASEEKNKLNFYYKYMTKESIYDGTYTGKKGIDERQYRR